MKQLVNNFVNTVVDTPQVVYTAANTTKIDSFTVSNNGMVNANYSAYLVPSGGSADSAIIPFKIVVWGENDLGIGIVNQVIPSGYSIQVESSQLNTLFFTISGREISE